MPNDKIRRPFFARFSLSFGFGRTPRSIDKIAKKTTKKHKFRHGFHCLLASGGRPAHRAKVALNTESPKKTSDLADAEFRKLHKKKVFGAILTEKKTENTRRNNNLRTRVAEENNGS